ncbi:hypothetical protein BU26DRAFT_522304 [Trematosphaeria pertusa]|uniref:Uncharacterized protein n=1 Tax=Trematosphaeria pertusa TaxID=390896 RepID=A0A6A6I3W4_9PLEO|nr:uncharacterized protein BU26DRAFT_522304 [Trematosphaeria pertusa]KAF2245205.1 hypothetical protein BU26DRAFT_522304 [Trematosphaeria pertusa]
MTIRSQGVWIVTEGIGSVGYSVVGCTTGINKNCIDVIAHVFPSGMIKGFVVLIEKDTRCQRNCL